MFHVIEQAVPQANHKLRLRYSDGAEVAVDFKPVIVRGGTFAALQDESFFAQLAIAETGRYIEWPGSLDFCADALRLMGDVQESPTRALAHEP